MSANKKFRIQNGVDIHGVMSFDGQTVISDAGKATRASVEDAVSEILVDQVFNGSVEYTSDLVPAVDNVHSLGAPDKVWRDVYIGPGSLYVNGQKVIEDNSGTITVNSDPNKNLTVQTTGSGILSVQSTGTGGISVDAGSESVSMKSDLVMSVDQTISTVGGVATKMGGALDMQSSTISNLANPSDASDAANKDYVDSVTSGVHSGDKVFADSVVVQGDLTVQGTTTTIESETLSVSDNIVDLNSNVTTGSPTENAGIRVLRGDEPSVQMRWNEASDHWETFDGSTATKIALSTSDLAEGSNQYFTEARARGCVSADANSCIDYDQGTGKFSLDVSETESVINPDNAKDADKLDGQHGSYYRINIYNVAGNLVN